MLVNRDPFARQELHRISVTTKQTCRACGANRKGKLYQYSIERDSLRRNSNDLSGLFCSVSCMRQYHDQ